MKALFYVAVALGMTNPKKLTSAYKGLSQGGGYLAQNNRAQRPRRQSGAA
jgi:hypothetical protein